MNSTSDNIAEPTQSEVAQSTAPPSEPRPPRRGGPDMFTIHQVCELIALHYDRAFKHLRFSPPMQITDGCAAEFIDEDMKVVVATCRMRVRNTLHINKTTGDMQLEVHLSDVVFQRGNLELTVSAPNK